MHGICRLSDWSHAVQVRADARITIAPLVDTLPCLGAVTISLLDPPHLDVSLSVIGGLDLMILPGIREAAHFALHKASACSVASQSPF
jgi:Ca2+-dependent lipid-binding protein